jgi:hypothetical protein
MEEMQTAEPEVISRPTAPEDKGVALETEVADLRERVGRIEACINALRVDREASEWMLERMFSTT